MEDLDNKKYWIWLSLIKDLGYVRTKALLDMYKFPEVIYQLSKKRLIEVDGIGERIAEHILDKSIRISLEKYIEKMKDRNIGFLTINDEKYPKILREIYDPPIYLYYKGNVDILNDLKIAIIGCRECSEYGKKVAQNFAYNLAKNNITIVSGLAKGIDTYAHTGVIYAQSKTIAILGNGVDIVYPKENSVIIDKIIEFGGCVLSEYQLGAEPKKMHFPARNRIISGLSNGIVVVEAKKKSGTLITVDFAIEQGRDVLVVPGNINSINSVGTNDLIKQGAKIVTSYKDIVEEVF